jgi:hypothetical protein
MAEPSLQTTDASAAPNATSDPGTLLRADAAVFTQPAGPR